MTTVLKVHDVLIYQCLITLLKTFEVW